MITIIKQNTGSSGYFHKKQGNTVILEIWLGFSFSSGHPMLIACTFLKILYRKLLQECEIWTANHPHYSYIYLTAGI